MTILSSLNLNEKQRYFTLNHEVRNDPVKLGPVVVTPAGQLGEVPAGLWCVLPVQLNNDLAHPRDKIVIGFCPNHLG